MLTESSFVDSSTLWKLIKPDTEATAAGEAGFPGPQNFPHRSACKNSYFRSEVATFPLWMAPSSCTVRGSSVKITLMVDLKHFLTSIERHKACKHTVEQCWSWWTDITCLATLRLVEALPSQRACLSVCPLVGSWWIRRCGKTPEQRIRQRKGDLLVKRWPLTCIQRLFDSPHRLFLLPTCGLCSHAVT